ncbi:type IX secretion system protein PorG [Flavobacterium agrisoli]|uniref:DUF6089 domain-containing protein n=1 Tax=Flavobacterium agrisoli TaxID=2793066 RepID=A0A934UKC2_9FLAO|nr:DUF6089 family protein [Flavobacterium agrisoli]MBK0370290.1 hypothetical protein [Flavobacterium agrisoli]
MNRYFYLLLCFSSLFSSSAQIHEVGVFLGGSNYIGDVGNTTYISPDKLAFGILYKWNRSTRHAYRFSYTQSTLTANDFDSNEGARNQRGYRFDNTVREVAAGIEFNFFDFNLHLSEKQITPYVYSGLSYFGYNDLYIINGDTFKESKAHSFAIPMTLGVKTNITPNFVLGAEISARYTFTDNVDGSFPNSNSLSQYRFGNLNNNDWYVFTGMTLTYTFGNKPCFCPY